MDITRIDEWLRRQEMTNQTFGERIGVTPEMGRLIRAGLRRPGPIVMRRIIALTEGFVNEQDFPWVQRRKVKNDG